MVTKMVLLGYEGEQAHFELAEAETTVRRGYLGAI
jgi:hypothetical protein